MPTEQEWIQNQAQARLAVLEQRLQNHYEFTDADPLAILCEAGAFLSAQLSCQVENAEQQWRQHVWQSLGFEPHPSVPGGIWATPSNPVGFKPAGLPIMLGAGELQRTYRLARDIVCTGLQPDVLRIEGEQQQNEIPGTEVPAAIHFNITWPNNTQTLCFGFQRVAANNLPVNQFSLYLETRPAIAYALASGTWMILGENGWQAIRLPQPTYLTQWADDQNSSTPFCWLEADKFWFTTTLDNWIPAIDPAGEHDFALGQNDNDSEPLYWLKCQLSQELPNPQGDIKMAVDVAPADENLENRFDIRPETGEWKAVSSWNSIPEETTEDFLERASYLFQAYEHLNWEKHIANQLSELAQQADLNQQQQQKLSAFFRKVAVPQHHIKMPLASPADIKAAIYGHFPEVTWVTVKRANNPDEAVVVEFLAYAGNDSEFQTVASDRLEHLLNDSYRLQPHIEDFLTGKLIMGMNCEVTVLKPWLFRVEEANQATMPNRLKKEIEKNFGNIKAPLLLSAGKNGLEKVINKLNSGVNAILLDSNEPKNLDQRNLGWLSTDQFETSEIVKQSCFAWPLLEIF